MKTRVNSFDRIAWPAATPTPPLLLVLWVLSSHVSKTWHWRIYLQTKKCGRKDHRSLSYCSCECGWAASSFITGAPFKFSRKENRKLLQLAPVIYAWQEGVWSPSNNLTFTDFLVTEKKSFPNVFHHLSAVIPKLCGETFLKDTFSALRRLKFLQLFSY